VWRSASSPRQRRSNRVFGVRGCDAIPYRKKDDADLQSEAAPWTMLDSRPLVRMLKRIELSGVIGSGRTHRWCVAGRSRAAERALCPAPSRRHVHPWARATLLLAAPSRDPCAAPPLPRAALLRATPSCVAPPLPFLANWNAAKENTFLESVIFFFAVVIWFRLFSSSNS
jgi:hypothetical protein